MAETGIDTVIPLLVFNDVFHIVVFVFILVFIIFVNDIVFITKYQPFKNVLYRILKLDGECAVIADYI